MLRDDDLYREAVEAAGTAKHQQPAFDPMAFEAHVLKASNPEPDINPNLVRFIAKHAGVPVVIGNENGYDWKEKHIILTKETAQGTAMKSLLICAHECAHARQQMDWDWLPAWALKFPVVREALELNCWRRAVTMLS